MPNNAPQRHLVTGGAGFLGSHLCGTLLRYGDAVVCVDNLLTGSLRNIETLKKNPQFCFIRGDAVQALTKLKDEPFDVVWSLAALASPIAYFDRPLETAWAGADVHRTALEFAADRGAKFLYSSTSEVYGSPEIHPQPETYWGNVNSMGPRAVYDESKRYGESLAMVFYRSMGLDVRIARIFNTYGPLTKIDDGRMIPAFLGAALRGNPLPIHGDGAQTRSLCYVNDLIDGFIALSVVERTSLPKDHPVINLGNPTENTVREVAEACWKAVHGPKSEPKIHWTKPHPDDPPRRCPDISRAIEVLCWEPKIGLEDGLQRTAAWLRNEMGV